MTDERKSALPLDTLDRATRERITYLLAQAPESIDAEDKAFLQARRDYLTADQRADYLEAAEEAYTTETTEPAPKPRGRRKKAE